MISIITTIIANMNIINLTDFITDDVNIIEIFMCKVIDENAANAADVIDVNINSNIEGIIEKKYKKYKEEKYKSYHYKDKVYTYELSNDNQYVSSKIMITSKYNNCKSNKSSVFILSSKIDKFPQYIFPCTNDIDNISTYTIKEFKINNRISLMLRYDYLNGDDKCVVSKSFYIEYRHSPNVEIDKINEYINNLVATYINC
jgi:hypothetical protein